MSNACYLKTADTLKYSYLKYDTVNYRIYRYAVTIHKVRCKVKFVVFSQEVQNHFRTKHQTKLHMNMKPGLIGKQFKMNIFT